MSLILLNYFVTVYAQNFAPKPPIVGMSEDIICSYTSSRVSLATVVRVRPARRCRIVFGRAKASNARSKRSQFACRLHPAST